MKNKTLKCGFSMPVLGMGTWQMGGRMERDSRNDDAGQIQALKTGLDLGFNLIDTAESYADGKAEELVGEAIRGYDRGKLFLTSKVWKTHVAYDDVLRAAENSLKRLGTDYLDLYLYHQVNNEVPRKNWCATSESATSRWSGSNARRRVRNIRSWSIRFITVCRCVNRKVSCFPGFRKTT